MFILELLFYYNLLTNKQNWTPTNIRDYAVVEIKNAGLNIEDQNKILYTIEHESKSNTYAINRNDMARGCDSVGLVQIRDCNHPEVSYEQATNPIFAVNFLIKHFDKCETWWKNTCGKYPKSVL